MKTAATMKSPQFFCEFTRASLKILAGREGAEFPLERAPDGSLTAPGRDKLILALKQFLKTAGGPSPCPAWCAIDARGVSLRRLLLPVVAGSGLEQLVRMQIETEFPLPPDELAWGFQLQGEPQRKPDSTLKQPVLVAAVKKEAVLQYSEILTAAGLSPVFTISVLARAALCTPTPSAYAVLDLGAEQSELACFDGDSRASVRLLPPAAATDEASLTALAKPISSQWPGPKLYIFGPADAAAQIIRRLPLNWTCEHVSVAQASPPAGSRTVSVRAARPDGTGGGTPPQPAGGDACGTGAILGLKKLAEEEGAIPLTLQLKATVAPGKVDEPALMAWGVCAAVLLIAVLLFPSFEALVSTAALTKKVNHFQTQATNLETAVDHELGFLQTLKQSQPPYLESFYVISKAAPAGIQVESLSMNRHGEMSLRGSLRTGDEVADFRAKLIASGYFASVTVEEQNPTPDHQRVSIRMTGQWKPISQLQALPLGPTPAELGTNTPAAPAGAPREARNATGPLPGMNFISPVNPGETR